MMLIRMHEKLQNVNQTFDTKTYFSGEEEEKYTLSPTFSLSPFIDHHHIL